MGKIEAAPKASRDRHFSGLSLALVGVVAVIGGGAVVFLVRPQLQGNSRPEPRSARLPRDTSSSVPVPPPTEPTTPPESTRSGSEVSVPVAAPSAAESAIEITAFGTRPFSADSRECFGEVKNNGPATVRFVKIAIRCIDRGQVYVDSTYVEPERLPAGSSGTFKTYVSAPQGTEWTAEIEGSGKRVQSTEAAPAVPPASLSTLPASAALPAPTAVFGVDKFRWWYTECCAVVAGTVYNRGMAPGHAQVTIVGRDRNDAIVETKTVGVEPYDVPPKSMGNFQHSFFSTAAVKWEVEMVEKIPTR